MVLDLETLEIILNRLGYEVVAVIKYDGVWNPISSNDVVPDELLCCDGRDCFVRGRFHPFSEVINCYQDVAVAVGSCRMYSSDDVYSLG